MSVNTQFQEHYRNLEDAIKTARIEVSKCINPEIGGYDDYTDLFKRKILEVAVKLNEIKELMD